MSEESGKPKEARLEQIKELDIGQLPKHGLEGKDVVKTQVRSVALTDAVVKDNISKWSPNMLKLYAIMILVTLSKHHPTPPSSTLKTRQD